MKLIFYKFHGTGNDFIMVDNRTSFFNKNDTILISRLCHRRFGIGADGLILLEEPLQTQEDFQMVYYNSDGNQSSMCGNGGRCLVAFAEHLGIIENKANFSAIDGFHKAEIHGETVSLKMQDVTAEDLNENALFLDTGSPHHIIFSKEIAPIDVKKQGASIRYSELYKQQGGANINFVEQVEENAFRVRTYERGVEDETYSCGTGVTAVAIAAHASGRTSQQKVALSTPGGDLEVTFENKGSHYQNIWLRGPAQFVFKGELEWSH